jgi:hypothetical protein
VTDPHIRILRLVAHHAQRELDEHHSIDLIGHTASTTRRAHLERAAARTRARVADANERRRNRKASSNPRTATAVRNPLTAVELGEAPAV